MFLCNRRQHISSRKRPKYSVQRINICTLAKLMYLPVSLNASYFVLCDDNHKGCTAILAPSRSLKSIYSSWCFKPRMSYLLRKHVLLALGWSFTHFKCGNKRKRIFLFLLDAINLGNNIDFIFLSQ